LTMYIGAVGAYVDGLDLFLDDLEGVRISENRYLLALRSV
jgi:hypothetical protein